MPLIRIAFFALLSGALAACGQTSPMPSGVPGSGVNLAREAASGSCNVAGLFAFGGPCTVGALSHGGGTYRLPKYRGFTATLVFGSNNAPAGTTISFNDATGAGDIKGTVQGHEFPRYPSPCLSSTCPGKAFLYLQPNLHSTSSVKMFSPGIFTIENTASFPGTKCTAAVLENRTKFGWVIAATGTASGHGLRITFDAKSFAAGPVFIAIACS